jgi:hypothetical protein
MAFISVSQLVEGVQLAEHVGWQQGSHSLKNKNCH